MRGGHTAPAQLPPAGIDGLDASWSHIVAAPDHAGEHRAWHLLDNGVADPAITLLCVHGNPSWSYLWRSLLRQAPPTVRVIAVDQLEMGFSERTGRIRRLADRVADLRCLTDSLGLTGPVVTVAHDWGGPISLGWAEGMHRDHPGSVAGLVLMNTAVHQPEGSPAPFLIRAARTPGVLRGVTVDTAAFIRGAIGLSRPGLPASVRDGFLAPYRRAERREAIGHFVADIPLDDHHPSRAALDGIAEGLSELVHLPALLLWGPRDPVFSDLYLHDLEARLPDADVHRFVGASHFVPEDADVASAIFDWLPAMQESSSGRSSTPESRPPVWGRIQDLADDERPAVVEPDRSISFAELHHRVEELAAGLLVHGVAAGDRVALMIPPGIDLTIAFYACMRMGAVSVLVDSGLGPANMGRALDAASPRHLIGITRAMAAAKALRWPGARISAEPMNEAARRTLGVTADMVQVAAGGAGQPPAPSPADDDLAAIVFTSGSTGPSKGVAYRHRQIQAQRDLLADLYGIEPGERLVAAFAPFALFGPALGITSVVPDMDVTKPGTLQADALAEAVAAIDATMVFASPAALRNVVATSSGLTTAQRDSMRGVRLLMSAGAPVHPGLLEEAVALMPGAEAHTPYGMTEVLPVADISLQELGRVSGGDGVCVGRPRQGVTVAISRLDDLGQPMGEPTTEPGVVGEVLIAADHVKDHYVRLWHTEHRSSTPTGWHRSGDVGHLDPNGYLWIGGRLQHVIVTAAGPVTPVALEMAAESATGASRAAAIGVGPVGAQVLVVVLESTDGPRRGGLADVATADRVRRAVADRRGVDVAAVLVSARLPVDRRHNSKIDRTAVAAWAGAVLAGERAGSL